MQGLQTAPSIDVNNFLSTLQTDELEMVVREASAMLTRRKTRDTKAQEAFLMSRLNEECVLSEAHWGRFWELTSKRDSGQLTEKEQDELFQLIEKEEQMRIVRVKILGELAQLKGIPLAILAEKLGINQFENA
ncbi:MAG: hypothetical protein ACKVUS_18725 [Saprospiraceae bacterium]